MFKVIKRVLKFMSAPERVRFYVFLILRASVSLLDLIGILAIGLLAASIALFLTQGSNPGGAIEIGNFSFIAVNTETFTALAFGILILFVLKAVFSILLTRQMAQFLAQIEARAARTIAESAFGKGIDGARKHSREEISFAVQAGSPSAFNSLMNSIGTLAAEGFLFILVLASFALVNPYAALGAILYFGIIGLVIQLFIGNLMHTTSAKAAESIVQANTALSDLGEVIRESTVLGKKGFFFEKIYSSRIRAARSLATQFVLLGMPRYIVETALIVAIAVFAWLQVRSGDISSSAATLGVFLSGGLRLTASLLPLQSALLTIKNSTPSAERALDFLSSASRIVETVPRENLDFDPKQPLRVSVSNVSLSYSNATEKALDRVSLEIPPGAQSAIIGPSGAGKSTLADLVLGILRPITGEVRINGVLAEELVSIRPGLLGYVPQKPGMVSGTIAENIAIGETANEIDQVRLDKAISDSHLSDLVGSLPHGIHTNIGKRKDELSGGQLQRIGLARALYSQPKLLVMDEATSALDAESENEINKALDELRGKVTVILIAHRLNTVQRSDVVFLMESGRITDKGTFSQLTKNNQTVKNLAKLMSIDPQSP